MITLHTFGPFLGTLDSSPFVMKTMLLLKLAKLPFRERRSNPFKAPRGLLPFIEDDGAIVADSALIRRHIERKYAIDFDAGLSAEQKALAWSLERMCEDHLYFAMLAARWLDAAVFASGLGRHMFGAVPAPLRPLAKTLLRRMNAKRLHGQGLGRHDKAEIAALGGRDLEALALLLGDKPFFVGAEPCGADATAFGMLAAILTPPLDMPLRAMGRRHRNLIGYCERITQRYFATAQERKAER